MKDFTKILNPGTVPHWEAGRPPVPVFVKVEYKEGRRLSITGVVGPKSNGDAVGGCGQITDTLARPDFVPHVNAFWEEGGNVEKLRAAWDRWHLNDMNPNCEHQRAAGWLEKTGQKVTLYHWWLTPAASEKRKEARAAALRALEKGRKFRPTKDQARFAALEEWRDTWTAEAPEHYEAHAASYPGATPPSETKTLGWLRADEHPEGLLCRPCPTCGYKYGSEWKREEVPEAVLRFLREAPDAAITPAWV